MVADLHNVGQRARRSRRRAEAGVLAVVVVDVDTCFRGWIRTAIDKTVRGFYESKQSIRH